MEDFAIARGHEILVLRKHSEEKISIEIQLIGREGSSVRGVSQVLLLYFTMDKCTRAAFFVPRVLCDHWFKLGLFFFTHANREPVPLPLEVHGRFKCHKLGPPPWQYLNARVLVQVGNSHAKPPKSSMRRVSFWFKLGIPTPNCPKRSMFDHELQQQVLTAPPLRKVENLLYLMDVIR